MDEELKNDLIKRVNIMYERCQNLVKEFMPDKWYQSKLEFEIKDESAINGRAKSIENIDYLEINRGVIELYYDYFAKVMNYYRSIVLKKIIPEKDDCEYETMSMEIIYQEEDNVCVLDTKTVDDKKASMLNIFVSRFIVLHELGHIFNGHCKYFVSNSLGNEMDFIPMYFADVSSVTEEKTLNEKNTLDIRTLEMDADSFAVTQSMAHNMFLYYNFESQVEVYDMKAEEVFYWWAFALRSHFLLCEDIYGDHYFSKNKKHLPSIARWTMIYTIAIELLDQYDVSDKEKELFKQEIVRGAMSAQDVFNEIKFTNYNWLDKILDNKQYELYKSEVDNNWENIKEKLSEYARMPLW